MATLEPITEEVIYIENNNHKLGLWINLALAVLLVIGIALTVYAITQVRSIEPDAKGKPVAQSTSATLSVSPNPTTVGSTTTFTVVGSGLPKTITSVNIGIYGEVNWVTTKNMLATSVPVTSGSFSTSFIRSFPYPGEAQVEVREVYNGSLEMGKVTVPERLARTTLVIR